MPRPTDPHLSQRLEPGARLIAVKGRRGTFPKAELTAARKNPIIFGFSLALEKLWLRRTYCRSEKSKYFWFFTRFGETLASPNLLPLGKIQLFLVFHSLIRNFAD